MMLYIKDIDADPSFYDTEVYYSLDTGAGFSAPAPIPLPPNDYTKRDMDVTFISNTKALAVWTVCFLTKDEVSAAMPGTVGGLNAILKNQNIVYAIWTSGAGWSAPGTLLFDGPASAPRPDGRPKVAAIPGVEEAWVVWVRQDNSDMIDGAGNVINSGSSIYARKIAGGLPVGASIKLSAGDEVNPKYDLQPSIAVSPSGSVAIAVWVRDEDNDLGTPTDRMLMYSVKVGAGAWSAAATVTDPMLLPGVESPSVALVGDDDGMIAFTARERNSQGQVAKWWGNKDFVYAIEIEDAVFQPAQRIRRPRSQLDRREGRIHGRTPIVRYLDASHATVVFRDFDGFGPAGGDGELAVATIDLAQPTPRWSFARDITNDMERDWEIAAAVSPNGMIRTVRDSSAGPATTDGLIFGDVSTLDRDMAIDGIRVSDPRTPPGHSVTLTAVIRNDGLRTPGPTPPANANLLIGTVENNVFQLIATIPFVFTVPPDGTQLIGYTTWMPVRKTQWRFIVQPIAPELDQTDNVADVILGVLPPANLQCAEVVNDLRRSVDLEWENGEIYDDINVYRNDHLIGVLDGRAESFRDATVGPGTHTWSVTGTIARAESEREAAECMLTIAVQGDIDADGDIDENDLDLFVQVLLGDNSDPFHVARADMNGDGEINGLDAQGFVEAMLGG